MRRVALKHCYRCELPKTPENLPLFHKNGTDDYCKACRKIIAHEYYLRKKEDVLAKNKEWIKNNPDKMDAARKTWVDAHPEKLLEYNRRWKAVNHDLMRQRDRQRYDPEKAKNKNARTRQEHPEMVRASKRRWNQANPAKVKAHMATRQARRKGATISDFTEKEWEFLKALYAGCCVYCAQPFAPLEREHIVSLAKHGNHSITNIQPSCKSCNCKKGGDKFIIPHLLRCADGVERPVVAYETDKKGYNIKTPKKRDKIT